MSDDAPIDPEAIGGARRMIVLTGMTGVGKSVVAQAIAARIGWHVIDLDELIEQKAGRSIPAIFADEGEAGFRARERDAVADLARDDALREVVIATGGWTIGDARSRAALEQLGPLVCLTATPETIASRVTEAGSNAQPAGLVGEAGSEGLELETASEGRERSGVPGGASGATSNARPMLAGPGALTSRIASLLDERWATYGAVPRQVAVDGRTIDEVAGHVLALLTATAGRSWRAVPVAAGGARYAVHVGDRLLEVLGALMSAAGLDGRAALVSDRLVAPLYGPTATRSLVTAGVLPLDGASSGPAVEHGHEHKFEHELAGDDTAANAARTVLDAHAPRASHAPSGAASFDAPPTLDVAADGRGILCIGQGEPAKSPATIAALWETLAGAAPSRDDVIVGLGGGVVTDVAGFAAATLLRGLRWAAVPTTLLAMVDAAIGGKTGVNLGAGKNLAGAFWQPALVVVDPRVLGTLDGDVLREGLAEVVKTAWIGDPTLLSELEMHTVASDGAWTGPGGWTALVARAAAVKAAIVSEDPTEGPGGRRILLNLGHTFAHAIESASGYRVRHGAAVAVGLVAAARLSEARGIAMEPIAERMVLLLRRLGLPTTVEEALEQRTEIDARNADRERADAGRGMDGRNADTLDRASLIDAMEGDKKRGPEGLRFVLPVAPGDVRVCDRITRADILLALR